MEDISEAERGKKENAVGNKKRREMQWETREEEKCCEKKWKVDIETDMQKSIKNISTWGRWQIAPTVEKDGRIKCNEKNLSLKSKLWNACKIIIIL